MMNTSSLLTEPLLPGATLGVLGGGQLGRMLALSAQAMGYSLATFEPQMPCPAAAVSDLIFSSSYTDEAALLDFAKAVDVITYEFENIPIEALDFLSKHRNLFPSRDLLYFSQNRQREKEFLHKHGFPLPAFYLVSTPGELAAAVEKIAAPCVLKTADFGYDGKGQQKITDPQKATAYWEAHPGDLGVLEAWVDYEAEVSIIVARNRQGDIAFFPLTWNHHENHILAFSQAPTPFGNSIEKEAQKMAEALAVQTNLVGILTVEMFLTRQGKLLINELAPRPHNSGHITMEACLTSQFQQHLRAICGLPLGSSSLRCPVLMRNLLGDLWPSDLQSAPPWEELFRLPGLQLHLYGKKEAKAGRKMGHYSIVAPTLHEIQQIDAKALQILKLPPE